MNTNYENAKNAYAKLGIDTESALATLSKTKISLHCWQGDDVTGFDQSGPLSGGIQATGNYPGKAETPQQLMDDMDMALHLIPGRHKINLHASYAIFDEGDFADRDALKPAHFQKWVAFAKARGLGIDFNPTFFSHPLANGLTLSSPHEETRQFWVRHGQACLSIAEYFAKELGQPCLLNIWIPDGYKNSPADRLSPRLRFQQSLDEILSIAYDKSLVSISLESKVFGIGLESYTVGSAEFCQNYALQKGILSLLDNGHYHPTESVADKLSSLFLFHPKLALHVTRAIRWDSDHVVLFDDEIRGIANELVACDALDRTFLALDYFDASINRIAAWVLGMRNFQKALLFALLQPTKKLQSLQNAGNFTRLLLLQEDVKLYPLAAVWEEFCSRYSLSASEDWYDTVAEYETTTLLKRGKHND